MPRVQPKTIPIKEKKDLLKEFWILVNLLKDQEQIERFFRDLLSESEALMLARRIRIAKFLLSGKSYDSIRRCMNTSDVTIANIHRWLQNDSSCSKDVLSKLERELKKRIVKQGNIEGEMPFSFAWLKKRYPLHFLLFNLFDPSLYKKRR